MSDVEPATIIDQQAPPAVEAPPVAQATPAAPPVPSPAANQADKAEKKAIPGPTAGKCSMGDDHILSSANSLYTTLNCAHTSSYRVYIGATKPNETAPASEAKPKSTKKKAPASIAAPPTEEGGGRSRRERKTVEFYDPLAGKKQEEDEPMIKEGSGIKLRDIPNVAFKLSKITGSDDLCEAFHRLLYKRAGASKTRKRDILDFSGFVFADTEEKEMESRKTGLNKWKLDLIHRLLDVLDIPRPSAGNDKAAKIETILEFLKEPRALSSIDLAFKEADKKQKLKAKKEREAARKEKLKTKKEKEAAKRKRKAAAADKKKTKKQKSEQPAEEESESEEEEEVSSGEEEPSDFEAEEEKVEKKKPAPPKSSEEKKKQKVNSSPAAKKTPPPPPPPPAAAAEKGEEEDGEDHDTAKAKAVSKEDLKASTLEVLKSFSDLTSIGSKAVLKALKEKYGFKLKSRKEEILMVAQEYIEKMSPDKVPPGAATAE
jgi:protein DEK